MNPITNFISEITRPNRFSTAAGQKPVKDGDSDAAKLYHIQCGRYYASRALNHPEHSKFILMSMIYWMFYKGEQWFLDDDLENFLNDEKVGARNRLMVTENLVKPMVKQYTGNEIRSIWSPKIENISPFAITRKEAAMQRINLLSTIAKQIPEFAERIEKEFGVGAEPGEALKILRNSWKDKYSLAITRLVKVVAERNDFSGLMKELSKHMAITGLGVNYWDYEKGHMVWTHLDSMFYFFDRGAQKPDLSDIGYEGNFAFYTPEELYEKFPLLSAEQIKAIENYTIGDYASRGYLYYLFYGNQGRIPTLRTFWWDSDEKKYGFVIDEYGYERLVEIEAEDSEYKIKDLVEPQEEGNIEMLNNYRKGEKSRLWFRKFDQVLRYAVFIPNEVLGNPDKLGGDILLEYGVADFPERDYADPSSSKSRYKKYCTDYHGGEITSPLRDVIDPQRMLNRSLSILESHMNNAIIPGVIYDKNMIDSQGGEEEFMRNVTLGKPAGLNANRMGINNAVTVLGNNLNQSLAPWVPISEFLRMVVQNNTGVNEAMQGTGDNANQLVGVQELKIRQGTLQQEEFYYAINHILKDCYQSIATSGKKLYIAHPTKLAPIIGDEGVELIELTKDMLNEDFVAKVEHAQDDEQTRLMNKQELMLLFQAGLLGDAQVAECWGKAENIVGMKIKEFVLEKSIAAQRAAEQQKAALEEQKGFAQEQIAAADQKYNEQRSDLYARDKIKNDHEKEMKILDGGFDMMKSGGVFTE